MSTPDARQGDVLHRRALYGGVTPGVAGAADPASERQRAIGVHNPIKIDVPHQTASHQEDLQAPGGGLFSCFAIGACLFHPHSSNRIVLVWHCGLVIGLSLAAGLCGRAILPWPRWSRMSGSR